jgi:CxxC-x17-CxxC domain-containing protein
MVQRRGRGKTRGPKPRRSSHPKSYRIVCSACGKEVIVQVPPPSDKKLLCVECFSGKEMSKEEK